MSLLRTDSLRLRLLLGTCAWMLLSVAAAGWGIQALFQQHIQAQIQSELAIHLDQLTASIRVDDDGGLSLSTTPQDPRFDRPFSGLYWQIQAFSAPKGVGAEAFAGAAPDASQKARAATEQDVAAPVGMGGDQDVRATLRSRSLWDTSLRPPVDFQVSGMDRLYTVSGPSGQQLLVRARRVQPSDGPWPELALRVAADRSLLAEPISRFNAMLVLALGVLVLGMLAAVLMQVWVGLRPLGRLRRQLHAVRAGRADQIEGQFPSEIQPLVEDFNLVLQRNAQMVEHARTRAGDLAHALKTPLAVMSNAAQSRDPLLPDLVREQVAAARRQVDHHLAQARAAAAVQSSGMRSPIRPLLAGLIRVMQRLHAERKLDFTLDDVADTLAFKGESQDFQEMLGNVLDNAGKWAHRRVRVRAAVADDGCLRVCVDDDGPGLSPDQAEAVFQRGRRADERAPGTGLGLSIVRELANLYGGEVWFEPSDLGGARLVLSLPAA